MPTGRSSISRILELPGQGPLFVCTDVHGNYADFSRMRQLFLDARAAGQDPFLLFTGDLIHGPNIPLAEWPDYLGTYFEDRSAEVLEEFLALRDAHPARVACLLGNHEHSHVGGPHTPKFWDDETQHFENTVGPERATRYNAALAEFPLVALAPCGVVFTHAAPAVTLRHREELEWLRYDGYEHAAINSMYADSLLGRLLWCRSCSTEQARMFLRALSKGRKRYTLVAFGHDIVHEGYERIGTEQLQLSTSFGLLDENKTYLHLELHRRYQGASSLREGRELLRLYPDHTARDERSGDPTQPRVRDVAAERARADSESVG